MTDKEFVNLQRVGVTLGRPLTLPFLQCQLLNLIHSQRMLLATQNPKNAKMRNNSELA